MKIFDQNFFHFKVNAFEFFFLPDQEFAEALKEFSPDHEGIQDAKHSVEELEKLKHELEQKRKSQLEEAKKQQEGSQGL